MELFKFLILVIVILSLNFFIIRINVTIFSYIKYFIGAGSAVILLKLSDTNNIESISLLFLLTGFICINLLMDYLNNNTNRIN